MSYRKSTCLLVSAMVLLAAGCEHVHSVGEAFGLAKEAGLLDARPLTPAETEGLVTQAWQKVLDQGGGKTGFDEFVTIAIARPQMNTEQVNIPKNLEGDVDAKLRSIVNRDRSYDVKDEGWLRRQIGDDVEGLYDGRAAELLRSRLGTGSGVQYVLVPHFSATQYEKEVVGNIVVYTLRLTLVSVTEEDTGSVVQGSSELELD